MFSAGEIRQLIGRILEPKLKLSQSIVECQKSQLLRDKAHRPFEQIHWIHNDENSTSDRFSWWLI
jgi:hypothetical protein